MKKYIHSLLFLMALLGGNSLLAQNISTGLDAAGTGAIAVGATDSRWYIAAGPSGPTTAKRETTFGGFWEPTPAANFACWLDQVGVNGGDPAGYYTFERTFTVSPLDGGIVADFGMAWDDVLVSASLIPPSGPAIPLTVPVGSPNHYWIGASVNQCVANPVAGTWKIQAVVQFVDQLGGFICSGFIRHCPKINISTGIDNNGNAIAIGAQDPNWNITAGPGTGITRREQSFPGYWQPTPVVPTNAGWINSTGTWNDPAGIKTYDRTFNIASGTASFTTAFGIAYDDALVSLELIPPGPGTPIALAPVTGISGYTGLPSQYWIGPDVNYTVVAPAAGLWTVRAKVNFIDQLGGFMLSGYISTLCCPPTCDCSSLKPSFNWTTDADCQTHFNATSGSTCLTNVNYTWKVNGIPVGAGQNFDYGFPGNGTYVVCLTTTAMVNGVQCVQEVCRDVIIGCNPCTCNGLSVDFDSRTDACAGTFTAITQGNTCMQQFSYEWKVNGVSVGTSQNLSYAFPGNGTYTVCVYVTTTLPDGTQCTTEKCKEIEIKDCTTCDCSQLGGTFGYIVNKCNIRLTAQPSIPACMSNPSYTWTVNGVFAGSGAVINKTVSGNGTYVICLLITVTKPNGQKCEKMICKDVVVSGCGGGNPSGMVTIPDESVVLYPNPATDELNVDFTTTESGEMTITFKTVDGKEVLRESKMTEAGAQHFKLGIPTSVVGEIIFVEITNGSQQIVRKVTIAKH